MSKFENPKPSEEQRKVLQAAEANNVILDSVAGSGKTTTIMLVAEKFQKEKILCLTYNKHLKFEGRTRSERLNLKNIQIESFHSFAHNFYSEKIIDDMGLKKFLSQKTIPNAIRVIDFSILIIDEAQDLKMLFFELIRLMCRDNVQVLRIMIVVGDVRQSIFGYQGADNRFLTQSEDIFGDMTSTRKWVTLNLYQTWRVPPKVCDFLNKCLLKQNLLQSPHVNSEKAQIKPLYYLCNIYKDPFNILVNVMKQYKFRPEVVFILAGSVKSLRNTPTRHLQNQITERNNALRKKGNDNDIWDIYNTGDNREGKPDDEQLRNKMVVSTFHSVKGLERKCVFLFGAVEGVFNVCRDADRNILPNPVYVGMTRAKEVLVILNSNGERPFRFQSSDFRDHVEYHELAPPPRTREPEKTRSIQRKFPVTALLEQQSVDVFAACVELYKANQLTHPHDEIKVPSKLRYFTGNQNRNLKTVEDVSDINGVSIIAYFQYRLQQKFSIWDQIEQLKFFNTQEDKTIEDRFKIFALPSFPVVDNVICTNQLLYLSNYYCALMSSLTYKLDQVRDSNWISNDIFLACSERLEKLVSKNSVFEEPVEFKVDIGLDFVDAYDISGAIDCVDFDTKSVYEFKCVTDLKTPDYFLQLAIYAYAWSTTHPNEGWRYFLINVLDNECWEITFDLKDLLEIIRMLIRGKSNRKQQTSSQEFTQNIERVTSATQSFTQRTGSTQSTQSKRGRDEDHEDNPYKTTRIQDEDNSIL
jgi:hypothetical protein